MGQRGSNRGGGFVPQSDLPASQIPSRLQRGVLLDVRTSEQPDVVPEWHMSWDRPEMKEEAPVVVVEVLGSDDEAHSTEGSKGASLRSEGASQGATNAFDEESRRLAAESVRLRDHHTDFKEKDSNFEDMLQ
ncbi:hypothetical protein GUJ93_ZPchr0005g14954 [Zizania palustris]|uniref:Uncharacterized protein n=1 Tax=Zizania palustris TaxID=103762 RepID=A0A8J5W1Q5_ZIZPA|nr:hypothetical protein GUJ93_ZPchr0005g14954 [Zizania palustris]